MESQEEGEFSVDAQSEAQEGMMTQSAEDLGRQSERNRAELAATVDRLKQGIANTTQDFRTIVSPEHTKSEVAGYAGDKAQSWVDGRAGAPVIWTGR
jgi:hypothetical protein